MYQTISTNLHELIVQQPLLLIPLIFSKKTRYVNCVSLSRRATWLFQHSWQIIEVNEVKHHRETRCYHRGKERVYPVKLNSRIGLVSTNKCNLRCSQDVALGKHCPWMVSHAYDWFYQAPAILVLCVNVVFLFMIMWVSTREFSISIHWMRETNVSDKE